MTARNAKPQKPAPRRAGGDAARAAAPHSKQESLIREALVLFPKDRAGAVRRLLAAVEESQAAGDPAAGAWALQILSDVELMAGNPDRALELARQGHDRALRSGDRRALANSLDSLGRLEQQRGDLDAAIGRFSEALGLREQSGRDRDIAFTCNNLSLACREKGDLARAIELQMRALAIRERLGDAAGAATSHLNIGVIYVDLGDWDKALESYLRALTEHERQQDKANVAVCCNNIAEVYLRRGKPGRAQAYLDRALVLSDEAQMAWVRAEVTGSLGEAAFVAGDLARAEVLYEQDRRLCADTGNREELCETLRRMAELYLVQGRAAEAGSALAEAAACGQTGVEAGNVERVRGELAAQAGSREEGLATLRRSVELLRPLGRGYELARALLSLGRVLAADGRGQPELEEAEAVFVDLGAADRASEARGLLAGTRPAPVRPDLLQSLTGLAVRGTGRGPFCREALDLLVRSLDAVGGAVLLRDGTVVQAGKAAASRGAATAALEAGGRRLGTLVLSGAVEAGRFRALADVVALGLA
ncbi:tetratricopeptide repeat protein, partial [candidate division WOR-3 bacterium]|nr:tetratricopeptide repeat protein [candidate division WOR-3 bacterium]